VRGRTPRNDRSGCTSRLLLQGHKGVFSRQQDQLFSSDIQSDKYRTGCRVPGQPKGSSFPAHPSLSILPSLVLYSLLHVFLAGVFFATCHYSHPLPTGKNLARVPVFSDQGYLPGVVFNLCFKFWNSGNYL